LYGTLHCNIATFRMHKNEKAHFQEGVVLPSFTNIEPDYDEIIKGYKTASGILRVFFFAQFCRHFLVSESMYNVPLGYK
jgi:phage-related protein